MPKQDPAEGTKAKPDDRNYPIAQILDRRRQLYQVLSFEFKKDSIPTGAEFERFVQLFREGLPDSVYGPALEDSLRHLAGKPLASRVLDDTCWRLAGNVHRLRNRLAVLPWSVQRFREWVPLQILSCRRTLQGKNAGALFGFRVLAGTPCPNIILRWWSLKLCRYHARSFGFSRINRNDRHPPRYLYQDPEQLVSMRLYGLIEPELCAEGPMFHGVEWTPSVKDYNREILKMRFRIDDGYDCPNDYPRTFACQRCPISYLHCPAGTHAKSWVKKTCPGCRHLTFFDPDLPSTLCIDCTVASAYKRK